MPEPIRREALARYLAGTASPEEAERVRAWLDEHPQARLVLEGEDPLPAALRARRDPEAALARIQSRTPDRARRARPARAPVADRAPERRPLQPGPSWRPRLFPALRIAAAVSILTLAALLARQLVQTSADEAPFRDIVTEPGHRLKVTLPDGSTVELNVASRLRIPEPFDAARREVQLEGEAFFEVASDPARPFVLRSGDAVVEVLGTAFNVEAYAEDDRVTVVVVEGRVALRADARPDARTAFLNPGDLGRLAGGTQPDDRPHLTVEQVHAERYLAWREGRLVFQGTPLEDVARELARWYNVTVALEGEGLAPLRLDAAFQDEPLPEVLSTIAAALEIEYRMEGRVVTLIRP